MREPAQIASGLFDKIRSRFENVNLGDEKAKRTIKPEDARFFNFDYVSRAGKNYGNITMNIADNNGLKIYYSKNITDDLEEVDQDEWFNFLREMRKFAKANFMTFDARDINKSGLDLRDIQQQAQADGTFDSEEVAMTESWNPMNGSARYSFQECGPVRIRIKHSANVDEDKRGDRSRHIEAIYIEHQNGERRLLPHKNLVGARATAMHCANGGEMDDELGTCITGMVTEMGSMVHFVRSANKRQFEDAETGDMAKSAVHHYHELKRKLHQIGNHRGYKGFAESFSPAGDIEEEVDVQGLRERFARKIYDDRFDEALPYVYRAYRRQQDEAQNSELAEEFESWANELTESEFEEGGKEDAIRELMANPIEVGIDGIDAANAIAPMFDSEELADKLAVLDELEGPDADARQLIINWMHHNGMSQLAAEIEDEAANSQSEETPEVPDTTPPPEPEPTPEPAPAQPPADQSMGQPPMPGTQPPAPGQPPQQPPLPQMEAKDPLEWMKKLAGLRK
jgi:hypothetical protein